MFMCSFVGLKWFRIDNEDPLIFTPTESIEYDH